MATVKPILQLLVVALFVGSTSAIPTLERRANQTETPPSGVVFDIDLCGGKPDSDIAGLGVRTGLWLQCCALIITICTGSTNVTSALPAAILSALAYNIILSMKLSIHVFESYPIVQDFWVAQGQLWFLTTILPFAWLFGTWDPRTMGWNRNIFFILIYIYTYGQTLWFWTTGWRMSDEVMCPPSLGPKKGVKESSIIHGSWEMFSQNGRYAMIVLYSIGILVLVLALPTYLRGRPGICSGLIRRVKRSRYYVKAGVLALYCAPIYALAIWIVESTVRRGRDHEWVENTGQWLALGLGVGTFLESMWYVIKAVNREVYLGQKFCDDMGHLGGDAKVDDGQVYALQETWPRRQYN